jgi:hypothetical protein
LVLFETHILRYRARMEGSSVKAFLGLALSVMIPCAVASAAEIPDLTGVWGRNTLDYAPPRSGPGPVRNIAPRPDMTIGDPNSSILKPWAAAIVKRLGQVSKTGFAFPTAHNQCWPEPPPYILGNRETQILQTPDRVFLIYSHGPQLRQVRLNAEHPAHVIPSWYGDSIGHYEDGALVVDTIGIAVKPLSTVDRYGTPHTRALHLVERYQLIDPNSTPLEGRENSVGFRGVGNDVIDRNYKGKALQITITVEDPGTFTTPWSAIVVARRTKDRLLEDICVDQIHDYITGKDEPVPQAKTNSITGK